MLVVKNYTFRLLCRLNRQGGHLYTVDYLWSLTEWLAEQGYWLYTRKNNRLDIRVNTGAKADLNDLVDRFEGYKHPN